jgi:prolyl oligopeptidase
MEYTRFKAMSVLALLASLHAGCSSSGADNDHPPIVYPVTKRGDVVDNYFGKSIADPYRWLENDPQQDTELAAWIQAQRRTTAVYLDAQPGREAFRNSLASAYHYRRAGAPQKENNRYFYTLKNAQTDQAAIYVREGTDGEDRILIDPAEWSDDGTVTFQEWRASEDGAHLAYAMQDGGSDWRTIRIVDVATGQSLADELKGVRHTQIAWAKDGTGFYYSRYPEAAGDSEAGSGLLNHAVYFHRVGTPQTQDELFYATPDHPAQVNVLGMTSDSRYAVIYSTDDLVRTSITIVDLESSDRLPRKLIENPQHSWSVVANVGTKFFLLTNKDAERSKVVTVDLAAPELIYADFVPQQAAIITGAAIVGDRLLVSSLVDAKSELQRYTLDGVPDRVVQLPGIGSVTAVTGDSQDPEAFFVFASFNQPNTVFRYDVSSNTQSVWIEPEIAADLEQISVEQVFYRSKDGTRIPMFVVRRKDVSRPAPTVLTAYGAFALSTPPAYSAMLTGWLLQGGVVAIPAVRGGGEYGAMWHEAGRREKKQNTFDDFIAAAEYLHDNGIAPSDGITAYGDSAGGLLIGAVVNQRPELFGAALPSVGVMDMLRFNRFTGGQLWVGEYGDPAVEADFHNLLSYSPYHNVKANGAYPAILVTTGEADTRVVPAHSFKYVAALQASDLGPKPRLLRIDKRAGHGAGKPTTQVIEEAADMWTFAARWTGLEVTDAQ